MIKHCVECGAPFKSPPSDKTITCSKRCSSQHRTKYLLSKTPEQRKWSKDARKRHAARSPSPNLAKGTPAALLSPISGPYETHFSAKQWVIKSPSGIVYECRNLSLWLREHADMLDGTPEQARLGLNNVKRSMQGKLRNKVDAWKGWTVIDWGD